MNNRIFSSPGNTPQFSRTPAVLGLIEAPFKNSTSLNSPLINSTNVTQFQIQHLTEGLTCIGPLKSYKYLVRDLPVIVKIVRSLV